jgi:hypothetical protein
LLSFNGRNPKVKSPEEDSHEKLLSVAVRELPTVIFPFLFLFHFIKFWILNIDSRN